MLSDQQVDVLKSNGRRIKPAVEGDPDLGPFKLLPGIWANEPNLPGRGWNMIALPFATTPQSQFPFNYRLLLNQYNEELIFELVDAGIPNRGIKRNGISFETDQFLVALDYQQSIRQIIAEDAPASTLAGSPGLAIHREPGLWLHMANEVTDGLDIARLATVPHGDSVLALGRSSKLNGPPTIPTLSGLPIGVRQDLSNPYLGPYVKFHDAVPQPPGSSKKFRGLFDPVNPNELLEAANKGVDIVHTTVLDVDTEMPTGGIANIPFITKQANASSMKSTFWIQELAELDINGDPKLRLQYSQVVMLDFFPRGDGIPGLIRWPHVSINTLEKVVKKVV